MLQKLRGNNSKGFTLIELMIVIAIIGILAAIAIPNFIAYRNKAFCSAAESDANNIASALADYFAIPAHVDLETDLDVLGVKLSGTNVATIGGDTDAISIMVYDGSERCPTDYMQSQSPQWDMATWVFTQSM